MESKLTYSLTSGIEENIANNFFLVNDPNKINFQEEFNDATSLGEITQEDLLFSMASVTSSKEVMPKLRIGIQAGFQNEASNSGFSARHIIGREHLRDIHEHYRKSNYCLDLIEVIKTALKNINLLKNTSTDLALAWSEENCAYVLAVDTKIQFRQLQHVLLTLYPSGRNKLIIGTLYLISEFAFSNIKNGSSRYRPVIKAVSKVLGETIAPTIDSMKEDKEIETVDKLSLLTVEEPQLLSQEVVSSSFKTNTYKQLKKTLKTSVPEQKLELFDENITYSSLAFIGAIEVSLDNLSLLSKAYFNKMKLKLNLLINMLESSREIETESNSRLVIVEPVVKEIKASFDELKRVNSQLKTTKDLTTKDTLFKTRIDNIFNNLLSRIKEFDTIIEENIKFYNTRNSRSQDLLRLQRSGTIKMLDLEGVEKLELLAGNLPKNYQKELLNSLLSNLREEWKKFNQCVDPLFEKCEEQLRSSIFANPLSKKLTDLTTIAMNFINEADSINVKFEKNIKTCEEINPQAYTLGLNCANLFIKYALDNNLIGIQQYDGFTHLIAALLEHKDELIKNCQATGNKAQFDFFDKKVKDYLKKYKIGLLTEDEYAKYQSKRS